jgi:autotransporter-associated beta strand protein
LILTSDVGIVNLNPKSVLLNVSNFRNMDSLGGSFSLILSNDNHTLYLAYRDASVWYGTVNTSWTNEYNWDDRLIPESSLFASVLFRGNGISSNDIGTFELNRMRFDIGEGNTQILDGSNIVFNGYALPRLEQMNTGMVRILNNLILSNQLVMAAVTQPNATNDPPVYGRVEILGVISGDNGFTKSGAWELYLGGTNTFIGNVTVTSGTLTYNSEMALGNVANIVTLNGVNMQITNTFGDGHSFVLQGTDRFLVKAGETFTMSNNVTGSGGIRLLSGRLVLSGAAMYTGSTRIDSGTTLEIAGTDFDSGTINNAGVLVFNNSGAFTYNGKINDLVGYAGGTLVKAGGATLTLGGNNAYSGSTIITGGTLVAASSTALGSGASSAVLVGDATGQQDAALMFGNGVSFSREVIVAAGSTGRVMIGFSGLGTATNSGPISLQASAKLYADAGGNLTLSGLITGAVAGAFDTIKTGGGTVTLRGMSADLRSTIVSNGTLALNNADGVALQNDLVISGGVALWQRSNQVNSAANVILNNGTIDLNSNTQTLNNVVMYGGTLATRSNGLLALGGTVIASASNTPVPRITGNVDLAGERIFNVSRGNVGTIDLQIDASVTNSVLGQDLQKIGRGVLAMNGNNTYDGRTIIEAGEIWVGNSNGLGISTVYVGTTGSIETNALRLRSSVILTNTIEVQSGGTRTLGMVDAGTATFAGSVVLNTNTMRVSTIANSWLTFAGTISGTGSVVVSRGGVVELTGDNQYTGNTIISGGRLVVNNTSGDANGTGTVVFATNVGGTLAGTGTVSALTLAHDGVLSPGVLSTNAQAGEITLRNWTWDKSGRLQWDLTSTNSGGWDFINIVDTLTFSGQVDSLIVDLRASNPTGFVSNVSYRFLVATAAHIAGNTFQSNWFRFYGGGFVPRTNGWGFVARLEDNNLYFDYVQGGQMLVIPEPNVLLLWVSSLATIYAARRRLNNRKNNKPSTTAS